MENRELVLRMEDAEAAAIQAINEIIQTYGLPFFLFEPIIDKIHRQLLTGKKDEILAARVREENTRKQSNEESAEDENE